MRGIALLVLPRNWRDVAWTMEHIRGEVHGGVTSVIEAGNDEQEYKLRWKPPSDAVLRGQ